MNAVVHILGNESVIWWSGSSHIVVEKLIRNVALIMITALFIMKAQKGSLLDFFCWLNWLLALRDYTYAHRSST